MRYNVALPGIAILLTVIAGTGQADLDAAKPTSPNLQEVKMYDVFELTFTSDAKLDNPFWDVEVTAEFTSPSGKRFQVEGFYYGGNQWRVRFVPGEKGSWRYSAKLSGKGVEDQTRASEFECAGILRHGSLRISKKNPYRFEYEDGKAFYPIGVQTGGYFSQGFDGPLRGQGKWRTVAPEKWFKEFDGAINLIRWALGQGSDIGCTLPLIAENSPVDRYDTELAAKMDEQLRLQKSHGLSHIMILFQDMSLWGNPKGAFGMGRDLKEFKSVTARNLPLQEKYIRYVVARFGCFVDIWELFNEDAWAPNDYLAHLAKVVRQADPYDRLITTNYARPNQPWCEIVTWHEYMGCPPNQIDAFVTKEIARFKSYGKPVLNTEFGNPGFLSNYDPVKWRIAVWAAYMNESSMLFWSMSGIKTVGKRPYRGNANAYLGPDTRKFFRVLNDFTRDLPIDMRPVATGYHEHNDFRDYALSNGKVTVVYIHHFSDHTKPYEWSDPLFVHTGPGKFKAKWIDPSDGKTVRTDQVETEGQYIRLKMPPVTIDLACRLDRIE